jgi:hypothetical protein
MLLCLVAESLCSTTTHLYKPRLEHRIAQLAVGLQAANVPAIFGVPLRLRAAFQLLHLLFVAAQVELFGSKL